MKNINLAGFGMAGFLLLQGASQANVVGTIDVGGTVDIMSELGSFSSADMQALITATNDLEIAGVLDAEGDFNAGNFSNDDGVLSDKISGTTRYGRDGGVDTKASGARWGFINGATPEIWTPDAGLYHFGLITTPLSVDNPLTVTVTYSDSSTETVTASAPGETAWIGFYKPGQTITTIAVSEKNGAAFGNYDDLSMAFVEVASAEEPEISIIKTGSGDFSVSFTGVLQESGNLDDWSDVEPAPVSPLVIPASEGPVFYRSRAAE